MNARTSLVCLQGKTGILQHFPKSSSRKMESEVTQLGKSQDQVCPWPLAWAWIAFAVSLSCPACSPGSVCSLKQSGSAMDWASRPPCGPLIISQPRLSLQRLRDVLLPNTQSWAFGRTTAVPVWQLVENGARRLLAWIWALGTCQLPLPVTAVFFFAVPVTSKLPSLQTDPWAAPPAAGQFLQSWVLLPTGTRAALSDRGLRASVKGLLSPSEAHSFRTWEQWGEARIPRNQWGGWRVSCMRHGGFECGRSRFQSQICCLLPASSSNLP